MSDTCKQLKQANEKIKELEKLKVIHGVVQLSNGKYQVMFDGIEIEFGNDIGCLGYETRDPSRAVNALIDRGRESGVIEDRAPATKPVVWVREFNGKLIPCQDDGSCDSRSCSYRSQHEVFEYFLVRWGLTIEVRIWQEPEPECEWVYGVWKYGDAFTRNINGLKACGPGLPRTCEEAVKMILDCTPTNEKSDHPGTPIFGVKEDGGTPNSPSCLSGYSSYYKGTRIQGSSTTTPEDSIEWVLRQLEPQPRTLKDLVS